MINRRDLILAAGAVGVGGIATAQAQSLEPIIDPGRPIVDPHHHLWDKRQITASYAAKSYLFDDFLNDTASGHNIVQTVFIECDSMYRDDGPVEMRPVGEVEYANGIAAMSASGAFGGTRVAAGIVGAADLSIGAAIKPVLQAEKAAAGPRFKGIRVRFPWSAEPTITGKLNPAFKDLVYQPKFREGFAQLAPMGLSFDTFCFFTQIKDVAALARAFPDTTIILCHLGGLLGGPPYTARHKEVFDIWKPAIIDLAKCQNVFLKVGGLAMELFGSQYLNANPPATSRQLAEEWAPYTDTAIQAFGPNRCMFESNYPVDSPAASYRTLWNTFKTLAQGYSEAEKTALFSGTARRAYRISVS